MFIVIMTRHQVGQHLRLSQTLRIISSVSKLETILRRILILEKNSNFYNRGGFPVYLCFFYAEETSDGEGNWTLLSRPSDRRVPINVANLLFSYVHHRSKARPS